MIKRFTDLLELEPPHWLIDPFCVAVKMVSLYLQEVLMDMQSDCEEMTIPGRNKFTHLWKVAILLVERGFSSVVQLLTKQRNRLDISQSGELRLLLTDTIPDVKKIIDKPHAQAHPSH